MTGSIFIIGAQKCATTTLFETLKTWPGVAPARDKEPHFFSKAEDWRHELPRYEALFPSEGRRLEASTSYTFAPHRNPLIWCDIHGYDPASRFIYVVRSPVDRIVSHYRHNIARGYTKASFDQFLRDDSLAIDASRYAMQIRPYLETFGKDRVLIVDFAELTTKWYEAVSVIARFLDLRPPPDGMTGGRRANSADRQPHGHRSLDIDTGMGRLLERVAPALRRRLARGLSPGSPPRPSVSSNDRRYILSTLDDDIADLEGLTGRSLDKWREMPTT
ncbi:MAG: sulfotransferase [Pacificimonas sp.]